MQDGEEVVEVLGGGVSPNLLEKRIKHTGRLRLHHLNRLQRILILPIPTIPNPRGHRNQLNRLPNQPRVIGHIIQQFWVVGL